MGEDTCLAGVDVNAVDRHKHLLLSINKLHRFIVERLEFKLVIGSVAWLKTQVAISLLHLGVDCWLGVLILQGVVQDGWSITDIHTVHYQVEVIV